jgi:hypothetical protein
MSDESTPTLAEGILVYTAMAFIVGALLYGGYINYVR